MDPVLASRCAFAATLGLIVGCIDLGPFACTENDQCRIGGEVGVCAAPGYCALPDESCESGFSFFCRSPADLAGRCVEADSAPGSSSSTTAGDNSTGASVGSSIDSGSGAGETGVLCGDRPCACAVEIAAGEEHTCAIRTDGSVVCWGINEVGELGSGSLSTAKGWPVRVMLPAGVRASNLFTGNHSSCVLGSDGELYCWGRNTHGEIDPSSPSDAVSQPVRVDWAPTGGTVGLSPRHSCVASADGTTVGCFGENLRGQLGSQDEGPGPFSVDDPFMLLPTVDQLAAGRQHSCARTGTSVSCWGADEGGALGDGLPFADISMPGPVQLDGEAVSLVSGRQHACTVLDDSTRVQCWGINENGQLGTGGVGPSSAVPVDVGQSFDPPVLRVDARLDSTCVLTEAAEVHCWGLNQGDLYGSGNALEAAPVLVPIVDELTEPVTALGLGGRHFCVIAEGAHVWCWGDDDFSQLGPLDPLPGQRAVNVDLRCPEMD